MSVDDPSQKYAITFQPPMVTEFIALRQRVGWGDTDPEMAQLSLDHSLFHVLIHDQATLVAMGRVVGDGAMYFYIQDVVVDPDRQNEGLGRLIMDNINDYLAKTAKKGATIGLLAAHGKEAFYQRFGFLVRTGLPLGQGMCKFV